VTRLWTGRSGF